MTYLTQDRPPSPPADKHQSEELRSCRLYRVVTNTSRQVGVLRYCDQISSTITRSQTVEGATRLRKAELRGRSCVARLLHLHSWFTGVPFVATTSEEVQRVRKLMLPSARICPSRVGVRIDWLLLYDRDPLVHGFRVVEPSACTNLRAHEVISTLVRGCNAFHAPVRGLRATSSRF